MLMSLTNTSVKNENYLHDVYSMHEVLSIEKCKKSHYVGIGRTRLASIALCGKYRQLWNYCYSWILTARLLLLPA